MADDIVTNGFDFTREPRILLDANNVVLDGHHRVSVLLWHHNPARALVVDDEGKVCGWERL